MSDSRPGIAAGKALRHRVEYLLLAGFARLMRALPRPLALAVGAALGGLGWSLGPRRRLVLANLRQALPELSPAERRRVAARAARNFGRTAVEFVRFAGRDRRRLGELVGVEGIEELRRALEEGRGAVIVTAHLGSWALYVTALAAAGVPSSLLVGRQHNPKVDEFILAIPGEAVRFISKGASAPRHILRALGRGEAVVMVADQRFRRGPLVPFLGKEAATLPLPGAIVARHGAPLFLMAGHRVSAGRHRVRLSRLEVPTTGDEAERRTAILTLCNRALGEAIRRHPEQYFWYHDRWRRYPHHPPAAAG